MSFEAYEFKNWKEEVEKRDEEIQRLNKAFERVIERLDECAKEHLKYWDVFDDADSYGAMNAYCYTISIVKEEVRYGKRK